MTPEEIIADLQRTLADCALMLKLLPDLTDKTARRTVLTHVKSMCSFANSELGNIVNNLDRKES